MCCFWDLMRHCLKTTDFNQPHLQFVPLWKWHQSYFHTTKVEILGYCVTLYILWIWCSLHLYPDGYDSMLCCENCCDWLIVWFRSWITSTITIVCSMSQTACHCCLSTHESLKQTKADRTYALVMVRCRQWWCVLTSCCTQTRNLQVHLRSFLALPQSVISNCDWLLCGQLTSKNCLSVILFARCIRN